MLIYQIVMGCAYLLALIPCFIVNLALEHRLSWFFIVLVSLMLAFSITNLPLMLKKHKTLISLAAASGLLLVLLAVCCLYVGGDWLFSIAYPCALVGLAYVWAMAAMVFYWKAQPLLRAGVCCMFTGVCVFFANPLFSQITKTPTYPVSAYFAPGLWQGPWVGQTASIRINVLVAGGFVLVGIAMAAARPCKNV